VAVDSGRFRLLEYPSALETIASAINAEGVVVGRYDAPDGKTYGFVWREDRFEAVTLPGTDLR
jgi:probable HAF family extracellular repeat protein